MDRLLNKVLRNTALSIGLVSSLAGCAVIRDVDKMESRAALVNNGIATYSNKATLLNILRARDRAPLSFVHLSQVNGHNTLSGTLGIPSITLGPHLHSTPRSFTFGSNSAMRSFGTDFQLNIEDDPVTYAALSAPVAPNTIGLFAAQGYPREILFLLFIDHLRVKDPNRGWVTYNNDPTAGSYSGFMALFYSFLDAGLTVDTVSVATGDPSKPPTSKSVLCIDPAAAQDPSSSQKAFEDARANTAYGWERKTSFARQFPPIKAALKAFHDDEDRGKVANKYDFSCEARRAPPKTQPVQDALQLKISVPIKLTDTETMQPISGSLSAVGPVAKALPPLSGPLAPHDLSEDTLYVGGTEIQAVYRSAYGTYLYLGGLLGGKDYERHRVTPYTVFTAKGDEKFDQTLSGYLKDDSAEPELVRASDLLQVNRTNFNQEDKHCFVDAEYDNRHWCVDHTSRNTKIVFSIIRQLLQLYSNPASQAPATISTRPIQ